MLKQTLGLIFALASGMPPDTVAFERVCAGDTWAYLVFSSERANEALMVNSGSDLAAVAINARLNAAGRPKLTVLGVLLTGGGGGEAGGLRGLPSALPVFADSADMLLAMGQARPRALAPWVRWRLHRLPPLLSPPQPLPVGTPMRWGTLQAVAVSLPGHTAGALGFVVGDMLFVGGTRSAYGPGVRWWRALEDADPGLARDTHAELCRVAVCAGTRWVAASRGPVTPIETWCPTIKCSAPRLSGGTP